MAYAALVSLENTIDRFLNLNQFSISVEEKQKVISLLEYVTPIREFLEAFPNEFKSLVKFPDESKSWEEQLSELANAAEDILEYLVLEKVFLPSKGNHMLDDLKKAIKETCSKLENVFQELEEDFPDEAKAKSLEGRISDVVKEAEDIYEFYKWEKAHIRYGEKWRSLPAKLAKFKSKTRFIHDLNKTRNEIDLIEEEVMAIKYNRDAATSSSKLAPIDDIVGLHDDYDESGSHPKENHILDDLEKAIMETCSKLEKLENVFQELQEDFPDEAKAKSLKGRIRDVEKEAEDIYQFYMWEKAHICYREKWRFLPAELAKFKCKTRFIHDLNKTRNEIDSIEEEVMAIKNNSCAATSSSKLAPIDDIVGLHDDDGDDDECHRSAKHELQLEKVMEKIASVAAQAKEMKDSSSSKQVQPGADSSAPSSSSISPAIHTSSIVGFEDHMRNLKDQLCGESSELQVIPICGMGGIGKTTLARKVFDDPLIVENFEIYVWVTISQDYSSHKILSSLLQSLEKFNRHGKVESADNYDKSVYQILKERRYLVVMDDIWNSEAWDVVRNVFPNDRNGSRVMLTTRLSEVASYPESSSKLYHMGLLNEDHSWDLFKKKVFADEDCPSELENIGKEIARRCKGLPLAIVVIAGLITTVDQNPASWQGIADKVKSVKTGEQEQIEEILSLSYTELPQYLRPCFLYMGSFPEDHEILVKKLIKLWVAEDFVKCPFDSDSFEKGAEQCLEELAKRNLVLVAKRKWDGRVKSCSLHDLMRELCIRKAQESKFFLNLMDRDIEKERFIESIRNQRRISVDSSYLRYISSDDDSTIHSIRCSKYHLVKLKFFKSVRLLRVLDPEPADVESSSSLHQLSKLFHLRYLAIKHMRTIPRGLSMLKNLETLILDSETRDQFFVGVVCNLRLSWCTPKLRHVRFHGTIEFGDPKETTSSLESLQTLSFVSHSCCTERILKRLPNLKKLKIDCSDVQNPEGAAWLNDLVHLHRLETLVIWAGRWIESRPKQYKIIYPKQLKKLTLSDLSLPWGDVLVAFPNLQVLKIRDCAWEGGTWETTEGAFPALEVLSIKCARLENWKTESSHFPRLKRLLLHSCWDLKKIPEAVGDISTLELIEVEGSMRKSLVKSAELIQKEQEEVGNNTLQVVCNAKPSRYRNFYSDEEEAPDDENDDGDDGDGDDGDDADADGDGDGDDAC